MQRYCYLFLVVGWMLAGCNKKFDHVRAEKTHLRLIGSAFGSYRVMADEYPENVRAEGLVQFLDGKSLDDEWETEIDYERTGTGYVVRSAGPDRAFGSNDDIQLTSEQIENWNN
jgi:hypothetical protein